MFNAIEIMELQKLAGMEKFSKRTAAEELERRKLIELIHYCTSCEECRDADIADHLIANGVAVLRWIPVTERLPGSNEKVLVCSLIGNQYVAQHLSGHFFVDGCNIGASHWMPLPRPPKGE